MTKLIFVISLMGILLAGCGRSLRAIDTAWEQEFVAMQETFYEFANETELMRLELMEELFSAHTQNQELQSQIFALENQLDISRSRHPRRDEDLIREDFINHFRANEAAMAEKLGMRSLSIGDMFYIIVTPSYVLAYRDGGVLDMYFIFSYRVVGWDTQEIIWNWVAYDITWLDENFTLVREAPTPRHLTNLQTVTVRFYYLDDGGSWETLPYIEETIRGENLWAESIRLIKEHNGIMVRDLWYDGSTLYVDLKLGMLSEFRVGLGNLIWADSMIETFYSFPDVENVIFLLDGNTMPGIYLDYCINERQFPWWYDEYE
ncbi:MAG: hypothetical protein FWC89_10940 [Defluviitaleaceae bacterium]|nr:hypothetical protein [Defluviitaleaceae bacterium]